MKIHIRNIMQVFCLSILVLGFFLTSTELSCDLADSRGNEFYFVFMPNYHQTVNNIEASDSLMVFISSDVAAHGYIEYQNEYSSTKKQVDFEIPAGGGSFKFNQYWKEYEQEGYIDNGAFVQGYNGQSRKCYFYVKSNVEVSVYALSRAYKSTDGAMIFPVDVLGYDYMIASYNSNEAQNYNSLTPSQFSIVAVQNNTKVDIELSTDAYNEKTRNFSITLQKGESYLVQADSSSLGYSRDLTGSRVQADRPVAVFTGHQRSLVPDELSAKLNSRDHLFSQLPPIKTFGKIYIVAPLPQPKITHNIGTDLFRIVAAHKNTELFFNDTYVTTLDVGEFYEGNLTDAFVLTASEEVMIATYKKTSSILANGGISNYGGDPFMLILPPKKQFLDEYITYNLQVQESPIASMTNNVYTEQYIAVVSPTMYIDEITIDNDKIDPVYFTELENSCYSYAIVPVSDGSHHLKGEKAFGVYVCGYGLADSYGYTGGMTFYEQEEEMPTASGDTSMCPGDSMKIEAKNCLQVTWSPNENIDNPYVFSPTVYPKTNTVYTATMLDSLGCTYTDQVSISIFEQHAEAGPDTIICKDNPVLLKASGGVDYIWDESPTLNCFDCRYVRASPDERTTYYVTVTGEQGCTARDSVVVDIYPEPQIDAGADTSICFGEKVILKARGGVEYVWNDNESLSCTDCQNPTAKPLTTTTYYLSAIDSNSCSGSDSIIVTVNPLPDFTVSNDTSICENQRAFLVARGDYKYQWYPADLVECDTCAETFVYPSDKSTNYYVLATSEFGCTSLDSVFVEVVNCSLIADSVDYPARVYCFEETTVAHIRNNGSQTIRIDSLVLTGIDAENFAFATQKTMPLALASDASENVLITFFPDEKVNYSAEILVFSELDDIKTIGIIATKERGTAQLSLSVTSTTHEKPGDRCKFAIGISSKDFATVKPNMIQMQIKYDFEQFFGIEKDFTRTEQLTDWSLSAIRHDNESNSVTTWDVEMLGTKELSTATPLFDFEPMLMLHGATQYEMEITGIFENREYCADVLGDSDSTRIEYCADTLRAVVVFQDDFAMETNGSIISDNLNIILTMPYAANIDLCLFDLNGRKITIFEGQAQQGKNTFNLNLNKFASQLYSLQFKCGKVLLQKKIIVQ